VVPQVHGQPGMQAKQPPVSTGQVITGGPSLAAPASRSGHWRRHLPSQHDSSPGQFPALSQAIPSFHDRPRHELAIHPAASAATAIPARAVVARARCPATADWMKWLASIATS